MSYLLPKDERVIIEIGTFPENMSEGGQVSPSLGTKKKWRFKVKYDGRPRFYPDSIDGPDREGTGDP